MCECTIASVVHVHDLCCVDVAESAQDELDGRPDATGLRHTLQHQPADRQGDAGTGQELQQGRHTHIYNTILSPISNPGGRKGNGGGRGRRGWRKRKWTVRKVSLIWGNVLYLMHRNPSSSAAASSSSSSF